MEYDRAARKRLGRAVRAARTNAGYANRADFADKMKRSTRQVQALENGEDGVGPDTWTAAAGALELPVEWIYEILDGRRESDRSPSTALADVSDEELAAEVLRRMKVGEGDVGRDAASIDDMAWSLTAGNLTVKVIGGGGAGGIREAGIASIPDRQAVVRALEMARVVAAGSELTEDYAARETTS